MTQRVLRTGRVQRQQDEPTSPHLDPSRGNRRRSGAGVLGLGDDRLVDDPLSDRNQLFMIVSSMSRIVAPVKTSAKTLNRGTRCPHRGLVQSPVPHGPPGSISEPAIPGLRETNPQSGRTGDSLVMGAGG